MYTLLLSNPPIFHNPHTKNTPRIHWSTALFSNAWKTRGLFLRCLRGWGDTPSSYHQRPNSFYYLGGSA